jgi:hypothetical protein
MKEKIRLSKELENSLESQRKYTALFFGVVLFPALISYVYFIILG